LELDPLYEIDDVCDKSQKNWSSHNIPVVLNESHKIEMPVLILVPHIEWENQYSFITSEQVVKAVNFARNKTNESLNHYKIFNTQIGFWYLRNEYDLCVSAKERYEKRVQEKEKQNKNNTQAPVTPRANAFIKSDMIVQFKSAKILPYNYLQCVNRNAELAEISCTEASNAAYVEGEKIPYAINKCSRFINTWKQAINSDKNGIDVNEFYNKIIILKQCYTKLRCKGTNLKNIYTETEYKKAIHLRKSITANGTKNISSATIDSQTLKNMIKQKFAK